MNKPLALAAAFLAACTTQATFLEGVPALAAGDDTFWVYYCDSGAELQMNYANMGGEYSVTPKLKDGKRVLPRRSDDGGRYFRLSHGEQTVYGQCSGRRQLDKNAVYLR